MLHIYLFLLVSPSSIPYHRSVNSLETRGFILLIMYPQHLLQFLTYDTAQNIFERTNEWRVGMERKIVNQVPEALVAVKE